MEELTREQENVRLILIDVASSKRREPIYYTDLLNRAGLDWDMTKPYMRGQLGHLLGSISAYEHAHDRPMLSSVVVSKDKLSQSDGFFKLAEELGHGNWQDLKKSFWGLQEMNRTFDFWGSKTVISHK